MHFILVVADDIVERVTAHHAMIRHRLKVLLLLLLPPPLPPRLLPRELTLQLLGRQLWVCIETIHGDSI